MSANDILKVIPVIQSVNLVQNNLKKKSIVKKGIENIVGSQFIKMEGDFINAFK